MSEIRLSESDQQVAKQQGTTLIETMVTMVVLSVGLLGIAAMQTSGLFQNRTGYERSQAVMLTDEILERIRVNQSAAAAGDYDIALSAAAAVPASSCLGEAADCTPELLAENDLALWKARLDDLLGGGDGSVAVSVTAGTATDVQVTVQWPPANTYSVTVELN